MHARQLKSADRAAELLTSLAPVASHPEETAREARRVATLVVQHVDRDVFAEALDEIGGPRTPASFLALFGSWLTEREIAAGAILEPIGDNLDEYPAAAAIADACTLTSRGSWTAHFDEAVRVARHFEHHDYPPAIIAEVLAEIRRDGLRHPGDADTLAQQKILELGHHPPKKFTKATARKTA